MKLGIDIKISGMAGMGPAAWDSDLHKMSMHPPLPGHIEHVQHDMERHQRQHGHRIVHRSHPENEHTGILISEVPAKYLQMIINGKVRVSNDSIDRQPVESAVTADSDKQDEACPVAPGLSAEPA